MLTTQDLVNVRKTSAREHDIVAISPLQSVLHTFRVGRRTLSQLDLLEFQWQGTDSVCVSAVPRLELYIMFKFANVVGLVFKPSLKMSWDSPA